MSLSPKEIQQISKCTYKQTKTDQGVLITLQSRILPEKDFKALIQTITSIFEVPLTEDQSWKFESEDEFLKSAIEWLTTLNVKRVH